MLGLAAGESAAEELAAVVLGTEDSNPAGPDELAFVGEWLESFQDPGVDEVAAAATPPTATSSNAPAMAVEPAARTAFLRLAERVMS